MFKSLRRVFKRSEPAPAVIVPCSLVVQVQVASEQYATIRAFVYKMLGRTPTKSESVRIRAKIEPLLVEHGAQIKRVTQYYSGRWGVKGSAAYAYPESLLHRALLSARIGIA